MACRCDGHFCAGEYWHDEGLLDGLEALRTDVGKPLVVNLGHRCDQRNLSVGGRKTPGTGQLRSTLRSPDMTGSDCWRRQSGMALPALASRGQSFTSTGGLCLRAGFTSGVHPYGRHSRLGRQRRRRRDLWPDWICDRTGSKPGRAATGPDAGTCPLGA
ncbi:MAG: hypothetical protein RH945_02750 [Hyphomonas sp.]